MKKKMFLGFLMSLVAVFALPNVVSADTTYDESWSKIVNAMKSNEAIQAYKTKGHTVTITDTDSQMDIKITEKGSTTPYTMTYYYSKNVVKFISRNQSGDTKLATYELEVGQQLLYEVAEYYGYDAAKFKTWFNTVDPTTLELSKSGLEFSKYKVSNISSFQKIYVDISCGISGFKEPEPTPEPTPTPTPEVEPKPVVKPTPEVQTPVVEEEPKNPETGIYVSMTFISLAFIGLVIVAITKKKNYFSKI